MNSVFITFLATEYLLNNNNDDITSRTQNKRTSIVQTLTTTFITSKHTRPIRITFIVVLSINIFANFHGIGVSISQWIHNKIVALLHIPRVLIAITSFVTTLYWDCRTKYIQNTKKDLQLNNNNNNTAPWSNSYFIRQLLQSFCRLLPVYPFLAVVISFGFLFIISAFEKLHLPLQILNMPIYYGTLYGWDNAVVHIIILLHFF